MKTNRLMWVGMLGLFLFLAGCGAKQRMLPDMAANDLTAAYNSGDYVQKVDNFLMIMDASNSMSECDQTYVKFDIAKSVLGRINHTLPPLKVKGGLRSFGHAMDLTPETTKLFYGMTAYTRAGLNDALAQVSEPGGTTPMTQAIAAAAGDLDGTSGKIAVIVVSDAKDVGDEPLAAARKLKQQYGDQVCIYTILVGNDDKGADLMKNMADAGGCGFMVRAEDLDTPAEMTDFVTKVFLAKGMAKPEPVVKVEPQGEPDKDSDGDGVMDNMDACPDTPKGARVDAAGCWILPVVYFDVDKAVIKSGMMTALDEVLAVLKNNLQVRLELQGYTDDTGTETYNQGLSERRAKAVKAYFTTKGIDANRLTVSWYGESQPAGNNGTEQGRALNRRTELKNVK